MNAYVESSVVLRLVLGQSGALREWRTLEAGATSALTEVECLRTLDRLRVADDLPEIEVAERREGAFRILGTLAIIELTRPILSRAAQPFPISLRTLDALHLASALAWRERIGSDMVMATHDARLAQAARAVGLATVGA